MKCTPQCTPSVYPHTLAPPLPGEVRLPALFGTVYPLVFLRIIRYDYYSSETHMTTPNSQAIAFYQSNLQSVVNYGLSFFEDRADRAKFNLGKKLAEGVNKTPVGAVVGAGKAAKPSTAEVTDDSVLDVILMVYQSGSTLDGNYKSVWTAVTGLLEVTTPWAHFRASQISRVGRRFEAATSKVFDVVCPDLRGLGGNWVGRVA